MIKRSRFSSLSHFEVRTKKVLAGFWDPAARHPAIWAATTPFALLYSGILAARAQWWRRAARCAPLPTISVGNLTTGGNGKTPFALFLASLLRQRGVTTAIVSRGYGGRASGAALVSDGQRLLMTPSEAGDEPVMLAKLFGGPVAVAKRRIHAIELLASLAAAEAVVLDDGFQHVRLRRNLDILLINQVAGLGNGRLLPAGPMREPVSAILRADVVILMSSSTAPDAIHRSIPQHLLSGKLVLSASIEAAALIHSDNGQWRETQMGVAGRRLVAVSGLGNPASFHATLRSMGANIVESFDYPDHHHYSAEDWRTILESAAQAEMVVTTEKDLVKLEQFAAGCPLYALRVKITMDQEHEERLLDLAFQRIKRFTHIG